MDLKNLISFIQVAELSSFTRAARALGYSQSTVSSHIRQLETELGSQLFERINHTVVLTQRGREILYYAQQITLLTKEMEDSMREEKSVRGHVRLAMADSLCDSLLRDRFLEFRRQYPDITLKITAAGTEEMFRLLNHNEADAILTLDNHIYNAEYVIVREEKVEMHFVANPECPLCGRRGLTIRDLVNEPFILTEKGMSYRRLMDEELAARSLEIRPILEIGGTGRICSLVKQGAGISFLPDYVTAQDEREGGLCRLDVRGFEIDIWKQLLYHRNKWISPQLKSVLSYCVGREYLPEEALDAAPSGPSASAVYSPISRPRSNRI